MAGLPALTAEDAARGHLGIYAGAFGLSAADVDGAVVAHLHDIGRGPIIVQFKQTIGGIGVFRESARVAMDRNLGLVAISGSIASADATSGSAAFQLGAADAVATAFSDLSGLAVGGAEMQSLGAREGGYESLDLVPSLKTTLAGATTEPARALPVFFHAVDGLIPAFYVEVDSANGTPSSDSYSYVISAQDGSILFRHNLTEYQTAPSDTFTYRVWSYPADDPANPAAPFDGPQGNAFDPHPTGKLDGTQFPGAVSQVDVTLRSSVFSRDPWLPIGATETNGNNADAYVDLLTPDGFTPGPDFRADVTGPNQFLRTYDPALPNALNQQKAAIVQMFYNVNFVHDWYYASGFTEAAGNAQVNNFGRGGVAGDNIRAEGQDFSGRNNANMNTPADGGRPRMQMFLFDGIAERHFFVTGIAPTTTDFATGVPSGFGIASHDVTAELVWVNDGIGSTVYPPATTVTATVHDGCDFNPGPDGIDPNWEPVRGKIAFIDRGGQTPGGGACGFELKSFNAQRGGAIGVIIASTTPHAAPSPINMGATGGIPPVTIASYQLSTPDGDRIRGNFGPDGRGSAGPITARLLRAAAVDRDGTIDAQVMLHELGHYISNRLVANSSGLTTNTSRGMGEGWADFHAMLVTVKQEDALAAAVNANYNGVYALADWVTTGGSNGPVPNQGIYFGIRRMPYSTDFSKNCMTYKNIQDNSAIPLCAPFAFWPAPGTTAANGGNSEVHNTGEVWASMLWECYASLLRDTVGPGHRLTFNEARDRMKDYLIAAYKLTPPQPTFLEARDAVLAAAYAGGDLIDFNHFRAAFARRGAGANAVSPDRYSGTNNGVIESFDSGADVTFVGGAITDDGVSCDRDGNLDSGESGHLSITLRNDSTQILSQTTATITAIGPNAANISFPAGNTISFPATNPTQTTTGSVAIALAPGLLGVQSLDFRIDYGDPAALVPTNTTTFTRRGNFDDVAGQSFTDDAESATPVWSQQLLGNPIGQSLAPGWFRNEISATDHNFKAADLNGITDISLVSPLFNVGTSNLVLSFQHRYNFEFSGVTLFDGGVVEITSDNGNTWTDVTALGAIVTGQAYTGALAAGGGNPLGTRRAFGAISPGNPNYVTSTFNLGTQFAGKVVGFRFRIGSDVNGRADGWEIDNISLQGAAIRPFRSLLPNKCNAAVTPGQPNRRPVAAIGPQGPVPERTTVTLSGAGSTDADGDTLTYFWDQLSGPPVILNQSPTSPTVSFIAPDVPAAGGSVVITLTVSDGTAFSPTVARTVTITNVDRPPIANAGATQTVDERSFVTLTGTGVDPDGDPVSFLWTQTAGPLVLLSTPASATTSFFAPSVGPLGATLSFTLTVSAGGASATSSVDVLVRDVTNNAPSASAGANQTVDERTLAQLHGSGTDPDGDTLSYHWVQVSPATPLVVLSNANDSSPTFIAPEVIADTTFTFQLTVSDGLLSATSSVSVTVRNVNRAPFAVALAPRLAFERDSITLDGSQSIDPDGQAVTYLWSAVTTLPTGASLVNPTQALATFNTGEVIADTDVVFQLVVNDGFADSLAALVTITVQNVNRTPVALATAPATALSRTLVTLDGSASVDPDGDALIFVWAQTGGPGVTLSDPTVAKPTFTAPDVKQDTTLTFALRVGDGSAVSAVKTVSIVIRKNNRGPGGNAGPGQIVQERTTVRLDALASTDDDGDALTFTWAQVAPDPTGGVRAALDDIHSATPSFTAPDVGSDVTFTFRVTVSDGIAAATADTNVTVKNVNRIPAANAGTDTKATGGASVTLDGRASADPDGEALTFAWSQFSGPSVQIANASSDQASFQAPHVDKTTLLGFQLLVGDTHGGSATSRVYVSIDPAASGGCSTGGTGSLAPFLGLLGFLALRRRRSAKS
jgi:large repetitive protein